MERYIRCNEALTPVARVWTVETRNRRPRTPDRWSVRDDDALSGSLQSAHDNRKPGRCLMTTESLTTMRELDSRLVDGLHVRLWWDPAVNLVWVSVLDTRSGDAFTVEVKAGQEPLDVFRHPFAYASRDRVEADSGLHATAG
jgi:hypothetical protein